MNEIAYQIESSSEQTIHSLSLSLIEAKKERYSLEFLKPSIDRTLTQWKELAPSQTDKDLLVFLSKLIDVKQPVKKILIPHKEVHKVLKLLEPTQKLVYQGKQLVIDFFGKVTFYYSGRIIDQNRLEVEGRLCWKDQDIPVSACDFIGLGTPLWFIHGIKLKCITTSISSKELLPFIGAPVILEGGKKQAFLDSLDLEDPDSPHLIMKEGTIEDVVESTTPYPVLRLMDRWGACADLWMDYGNEQFISFHHTGFEEKKNSFKRNSKVEEAWEKDLLETDFIKKIVGSSHYYCPLNCVPKSLSFLIELGWQVKDIKNRQVIKHRSVELNLQETAQSITIKGGVHYDSFEAKIQDVVGAFNRREHFIQLSSNTIGLLPLDDSRKGLCELAEEGECIGEEIHVKKSHFGTLEELWNSATAPSHLLTLKDKWKNFTGIEEALPSELFSGQLRPYQQIGVNWLNFLYDYGFHGILADEMGLGKTIQLLAFLSRIPRGMVHLIVLPTSLLFNWKNEITKFLPSFRCYVHQGPQRESRVDILKEYDIILTSYTTLRIDLPLLQSIDYRTIILDEAQVIKNAHTQIAKAVCQLKGTLRLCVTGTPVENHMNELWSHFHFLIPELFGAQDVFEGDILASQSDKRYLERIKKKIAPFILRRRKQEVLDDLPERIDQLVWIEMEDEQRTLYDHLLAQFKGGLLKKVKSEGMGKHRMEVLEAILRLRQVCCHPLLVSSLSEVPVTKSAKFDTLMEDLETLIEEKQKVLIYSQFTSMLHLMKQEATKRDWSFGSLDGSTKERETVVNRFQNDPSQALFFVSLKAGGVGLNLTAADYVYLYDPWWNDAAEEQAINRAHRIGRKSQVFAKRLIVAESIEERILKLKESKRGMVEELFESETSTTGTNFTVEDLDYLFS